MKLLTLLKPGANIASPLLVIFYLLSVAGDLGTTYLGTPDLKYEGNWIVRHFNLKWPEVITYASLHAIGASLLFLVSCRYIFNYYRVNNQKSEHTFVHEVFHNMKLLASFFFLGYLYKNLFYTIYIVISNYLSYVYLYKVKNIFSELATVYVNLEIKFIPYFFPVIETVFILFVTFFIYKKGKRIRNEFRLPQQDTVIPVYKSEVPGSQPEPAA